MFQGINSEIRTLEVAAESGLEGTPDSQAMEQISLFQKVIQCHTSESRQHHFRDSSSQALLDRDPPGILKANNLLISFLMTKLLVRSLKDRQSQGSSLIASFSPFQTTRNCSVQPTYLNQLQIATAQYQPSNKSLDGHLVPQDSFQSVPTNIRTVHVNGSSSMTTDVPTNLRHNIKQPIGKQQINSTVQRRLQLSQNNCKLEFETAQMVGKNPEQVQLASKPTEANTLDGLNGQHYLSPSKPLEHRQTYPIHAYNSAFNNGSQFLPYSGWGCIPFINTAFQAPYGGYVMYPAHQLFVARDNGSTNLSESKTVEVVAQPPTQNSETKRSRSRSRQIRKSTSPKKVRKSKKMVSPGDQTESPAQNKERPQKFMLKVIFTPLKRILKSKRLIDLGIDMSDYFSVREEPLGGHRTPADIELMLWYVEEKYYETPELYGRFVDYLVENRRDLELYGEEAYGEKYSDVWLAEYRKLLNTIYNGIQTKGSSNARFQNLYSRRPSEQSFHNLRELKELFYSKGVIPRPTNK